MIVLLQNKTNSMLLHVFWNHLIVFVKKKDNNNNNTKFTQNWSERLEMETEQELHNDV